MAPAPTVKMTAIAFGTRCGPSGNILHTDPDGTDPKAVNPRVSEEDAEFLETEGLAVRTKKPAAATSAPAGDGAKGAKGAAAAGGRAAKPAAATSAPAGGAAPASEPVVDASEVKDTDPDVPPAA